MGDLKYFNRIDKDGFYVQTEKHEICPPECVPEMLDKIYVKAKFDFEKRVYFEAESQDKLLEKANFEKEELRKEYFEKINLILVEPTQKVIRGAIEKIPEEINAEVERLRSEYQEKKMEIYNLYGIEEI